MSKIQIQPINLSRHLPTMIRIDQECHLDAWDEQLFTSCLSQKDTSGMVIYCDYELSGYLLYQKTKNTYRILNLTVAPWKQRFGLATEMMNTLKKWLNDGTIEMKVSERCLEAHLFLAKQGFKAEKVLQNYFRVNEEYEDAYCFTFYSAPKSTTKLELKEIFCE